MNAKAFGFAILGLIVSACLSMAWVGHDMHQINIQDRAKLTRDCHAAQSSANATGPGATDPNGADPTAATPSVAATTTSSAPAITDKLIASCSKVGITLPQPASASTAPVDSTLTAPGGAPGGVDANGAISGNATAAQQGGGSGTQLAPLEASGQNGGASAGGAPAGTSGAASTNAAAPSDSTTGAATPDPTAAAPAASTTAPQG